MTDHVRWEDDAAAYALGALEDHEATRFEEHLAGCDRCRDQLAAMRSAAAALPESVPPLTPRPMVRERVMAIVREEAAASAGPQTAGAGARRWGRRGRLTVPFGVGAAAATAAVVAIVIALAGSGSASRTYVGVVFAPGASASVRESGGHAQLTFARLPAPPSGRLYEVWLQRPGRPLEPARALFTERSGSLSLRSGQRLQRVLVTAEPRPSGSRSPTRAPLIVVRLA